MLAIRLRQAVVYTTTGVFFLVAATAQLQGASIADTFMKAGVACIVMAVVGVAGLRIVDDALQKPAKAAQAAGHAATKQPAGAAGAQTPVGEAVQG